jgi:hypothetical protein
VTLTTEKELPRGAAEWRELHDELFDLHVEKTSQYGAKDSAFANVEASALCGVEPWRRCLCDSLTASCACNASPTASQLTTRTL